MPCDFILHILKCYSVKGVRGIYFTVKRVRGTKW